jgi:hypothetical protein
MCFSLFPHSGNGVAAPTSGKNRFRQPRRLFLPSATAIVQTTSAALRKILLTSGGKGKTKIFGAIHKYELY